jgi:ABC-type nitrate/sulfonate/bicarbonate transport system ATPase subunit
MLKIIDLSKKYGDKKVIESFNMSCESAGVFAVMGASGVGKTTLLNIIAGLDKDYQGEVLSLYKKISYKFQEPRLLNWLTAKENVKCVVEDESDSKALFWLEKVGLKQDAEKYPSELSGGMQQRVALARALAYNADLLLLDEPFSAVDEDTKRNLLNVISDYAKDHCVILVTHDIDEATALNAEIITVK